MRSKVFVIVNQHFDLMWRRAFEEDIVSKGKCYVSYSKLQAYYIEENLKLTRKYPEYRFQIETPAVLEQFLKTHKSYYDEIADLIRNGRILIPFTGNNIIDTNLIQGEGIIRNYLYGYTYLKDNFGITPDGCDRNDAFGNSAQLPQIVNSFGVKWMYNLRYSFSDKPYWRGLDGSVVFLPELKPAASVGGWYKYRPCPECNGFGGNCDSCNGRGIDEKYIENFRDIINELDMDVNGDYPAYIYVSGEEILPNEQLMEWIESNRDNYDFEFVGMEKFNAFFGDKLNFTCENEIFSNAEINPNNTGCYVSRIKLKQRIRYAENLMRNIEGLSVLYYHQKDYSCVIKEIWNKLLLAFFHDAITGTHVDAAYIELCNKLDGIVADLEKIRDSIIQKNKHTRVLEVINTSGVWSNMLVNVVIQSECQVALESDDGNKVLLCDSHSEKDGYHISFVAKNVPPYGKNTYKIVEADKEFNTDSVAFEEKEKINVGAVLSNEVIDNSEIRGGIHYEISNEYFDVICDENGICDVYDKNMRMSICASSEYRPGEWILEHDEGSPWATLSQDRYRIPLTKYTHLKEIIKGEGFEKAIFEITPGILDGFSVFGIKIRYEVILYKGIDKVMFESDVFWDTFNHRLRIAFPTAILGEYAYEIPYGIINREPYADTISKGENWASACGDWPAINWAGVENDAQGFAVFNKGTPSYTIKKDKNDIYTVYLSVLRSPSVPTYLHDPSAYSMMDWDGMRDSGEHHFSYAIKAYTSSLHESNAPSDGIDYNNVPIVAYSETSFPEFITFSGRNVINTAVKIAENKKGVILRFVEYGGNKEKIVLNVPDCFGRVFEMDMKEDVICEKSSKDVEFKPYEIKTIFFEFNQL